MQFTMPHKISGATEKKAFKNARRCGWTINKSGEGNPDVNGTGRTVCPYCNNK